MKVEKDFDRIVFTMYCSKEDFFDDITYEYTVTRSQGDRLTPDVTEVKITAYYDNNGNKPSWITKQEIEEIEERILEKETP